MGSSGSRTVERVVLNFDGGDFLEMKKVCQRALGDLCNYLHFGIFFLFFLSD